MIIIKSAIMYAWYTHKLFLFVTATLLLFVSSLSSSWYEPFQLLPLNAPVDKKKKLLSFILTSSICAYIP